MSDSLFAVPVAWDPKRMTKSGFNCRRTASRRDSTTVASTLPIRGRGGRDGIPTVGIVERLGG